MIKRSQRNLLALAATGMVAAGCVTVPPEEDPVLIKLTQLEDRLSRVERVLENQSLVGIVTELQQVRGEIAQLRDQVETLTFETENSAKRQRDLYVDIDRRLNGLEAGRGITASASGPATGDDAAVATGASLDRDAYRIAFELLEEGRYAEASVAFENFVANYPDSALVDNAQYWLAEAIYVERDFARALSEFTRVVEQHPQSRKVPDALLKIGYAHYEMSDWAQARAALERVVAEHPGSTAARLAGQRLERMSREGR